MNKPHELEAIEYLIHGQRIHEPSRACSICLADFSVSYRPRSGAWQENPFPGNAQLTWLQEGKVSCCFSCWQRFEEKLATALGDGRERGVMKMLRESGKEQFFTGVDQLANTIVYKHDVGALVESPRLREQALRNYRHEPRLRRDYVPKGVARDLGWIFFLMDRRLASA